MLPSVPPRLVFALLWAMLTFISLALRPLFPIDETRYAAVAWEMWQSGDFLVPHLNGETYSHKPPLLFWLIHLSWVVLGVNEWSLRLIAPMFSLAALYLSQAVAKLLWPEKEQIAQLTPLVLLGSYFWMVFGTLTMFDIMLSFFALLGIYALLLLIRQGASVKRWLLLGIAIGGGVLTKGPVILLHLLPFGLLAPWLLPSALTAYSKSRWYMGLLTAVLTGAAIALCWAIPAGMAGGETYRKAIFLGQTSGRIVDSFAHKLPFWWYLQILPLILLPWVLIRPFWQGLKQLNIHDFGLRFCLVWAVPVLMAFSLVSGKRIHYLLPLMPALALMIAWLLTQSEDINWRRVHWVIAAIFGFMGLILFLMPLSQAIPVPPLMAGLSPLWGGLLLLLVCILMLTTPKNIVAAVNCICISAIVSALILCAGFFQIQGYRFDTAPPAQKIAGLMAKQQTVAFLGGKYHGQFHFAGRLTQPIALLANQNELLAFMQKHPNGFVLVEHKETANLPVTAVSFRYPFKSHQVSFIACQTLINNPALVSQLKPA